jgi:tetratricopeptide (TPR) repeat protein
VVDKASEVLEELGRLKGRVQELMRDEVFMSYIVTRYIRRADEETVKKVILREALILKHELAHYRFKNGELDEAARLLSEAAEEYKEIGDYENYLVARGWALRAEAINGSLVGKELVDEFRQLYEEARRRFKFTARHLSSALNVLSGYLVSLALTGDYETINKLLKRYQRVLNADKQVSVLTRLALSALLNPRGEVNSELKGRLNVNPEELIDAFEYKMYNEFLPALRVAFGTAKPEDVDRVCETIKDSMEKRNCKIALLAAKGDAAVEQLREWLIDTFSERISEEERLNLLKGLGVNVDKLLNMLDEFMELVYGLDGKSLVQLIAPETSTARLALMLRALINGDEMLAKAHALMGAVYATEKPSARLFLEAYRACCDPNNEEFRRAIAKLFFLHV